MYIVCDNDKDKSFEISYDYSPEVSYKEYNLYLDLKFLKPEEMTTLEMMQKLSKIKQIEFKGTQYIKNNTINYNSIYEVQLIQSLEYLFDSGPRADVGARFKIIDIH